jgi:hypothetical protein
MEENLSWKQYGDFAFYACTVATVAFVIAYLVLAPWYRTTTGRNIMAVMGSVALAFVYFTVAIQQGGVPFGFYPIRALLFTFIFLSVGWRVIILVRAQVAARNREEQP